MTDKIDEFLKMELGWSEEQLTKASKTHPLIGISHKEQIFLNVMKSKTLNEKISDYAHQKTVGL